MEEWKNILWSKKKKKKKLKLKHSMVGSSRHVVMSAVMRFSGRQQQGAGAASKRRWKCWAEPLSPAADFDCQSRSSPDPSFNQASLKSAELLKAEAGGRIRKREPMGDSSFDELLC